jgi:hypothetical protein
MNLVPIGDIRVRLRDGDSGIGTGQGDWSVFTLLVSHDRTDQNIDAYTYYYYFEI